MKCSVIIRHVLAIACLILAGCIVKYSLIGSCVIPSITIPLLWWDLDQSWKHLPIKIGKLLGAFAIWIGSMLVTESHMSGALLAVGGVFLVSGLAEKIFLSSKH